MTLNPAARAWTRFWRIMRVAYRHWRLKLMPLDLDLADEEIAALTIEADRRGTTPKALARELILRSLPQREFSASEGAKALDTGRADAVDQELDLGERLDDGGMFPLPPEAAQPRNADPAPPAVNYAEVHGRTQTPQHATQPLAQTERVTSHPCTHFSDEQHPSFSASASPGMCKHKNRLGGMCNWPPSAARGCGDFNPKRRLLPVAPTEARMLPR